MKILFALLALFSLTLIGCTSGKCPFAKKASGSACCAEKKAACCSH